MIDTTCKRHETVHEVDMSQCLKLLPREMNEPAYWRHLDITAPTTGPNAKLVPQQPSWQASPSDSCHARHHPSRRETVHEGT